MKRFIYSPDVQAYISSEEHGIIDVSADIVSGNVHRVLNAASTASLTLNSPNWKYLRVFKPMDRISIYLTRIKPVLVFTGYLDRVTMDQLYPGPVTLDASCTLKRLLYTYWDPSLPYTEGWFAQHGWSWDIGTGNIFSNAGQSLWNLDLNGTIGHMMRQVMHDIGNWDIGDTAAGRNTVHILALPDAFLKKTQAMIANAIQANEEQQQNIMKFLKSLLTVQGITGAPFDDSGYSISYSSTQVDDLPVPSSITGAYHASIYGPPTNLSGFAGALIKEAKKSGLNITSTQAQNAQIVVSVTQNAGFDNNGSAGFVGAAYAESGLIADRAQVGGGGGSGLFQLTSDNFFGTSGVLNQVSGGAAGDAQPINSGNGDNGKAASNPTWNTQAILRNADVTNAVTFVNNAGDALGAVEAHFTRPGASYGNEADAMYSAAQRALANPATVVNDPSLKGAVGDVKVGDQGFFLVERNPDGSTTKRGATFRIKGNPYNDDTMVFRAASYDSAIGEKSVKIYVPGAQDKSSSIADAWNNKNVTIESSVNQASRFPTGSANPNTTASSVAPSGGNASTIASKVVQIAMGEVGTKESGYNAGPQVDKYLQASGLSPGQPWCAAFVNWVFQQAGRPLREANNSGATAAIQAAYPNTNDPQPGDIVTWSDFHTGLIVRRDGNTVYTVEGNAGPTTDEVYEEHFLLSDPTTVEGSSPTYNRVPGIGLAATNSNVGGTSSSTGSTSTVYGGTGVQLTQTTVAQISAATGVGLGLVFPLVSAAAEAANFTGLRALQNDVPLMDWIKFTATASQRQFQSLPNGDFMAFYPDYFNWSGEAPYFIISDIETQDLTIDVSDETLATHVFTTADTMSPNGSIDLDDQLASTVASVESVGTFNSLLGLNSQTFDAQAFLKRYGARPLVENVVEIKSSFMQFMYGWQTFLQKWASMFYATPTFTFMPELYPGGLIEFQSKDLTMFINSVSHNFDRAGGFTTTAELIAPSTRSNTGNFSFPMVLTSNGYKQK